MTQARCSAGRVDSLATLHRQPQLFGLLWVARVKALGEGSQKNRQRKERSGDFNQR